MTGASADIAQLEGQARELGVELTPDEAQRLLAYLDAMLAENQHVNLTGIRDRAQAITLHVLDSIAARLLPLEFDNAVDLGTGNGFPGAALAILHPQSQVTLLDRTEKKVRAIERALAQAKLTNIRTAAGDAAQAKHLLPTLHHRADLITARAVATPEKVAQLATHLATKQATLLLWLGPKTDAPETLPGGFQRTTQTPYELPGNRHHRLASYTRGR